MGDPRLPRRTFSFVPRNKYLAIVAFAALLLSVVELTDVVQLPFETPFSGALASGGLFSTDLVNSMLAIGYVGLFVLMTGESASLPIPSEVVLPWAGYLVFLGKMNLGLAILDSTAALLAGALIDYFLALWLGRPIIYGILGRLGVSSTHIDDGERWVDSKGSWSVFIARFIPGVRSIISVPAGLLRMKLSTFVVMTLGGSVIWSAVLIYVGYSAGPLWKSATGALSASAAQIALFLIAGLSVLYVIYYLGPLGRKK